MKAVILAGGRGTRLAEETDVVPKPMVEIGGKPILWHIMNIYANHGITDFVICLGYRGYVIKEYFANYYLHRANVTFDLAKNATTVHEHQVEPWRVTLIDTGESTQTGGRLRRVLDHVREGDFCFTYGDGVANVDVSAVVAQHRAASNIVTVTAVQPPARFGSLQVDGEMVTRFSEKSPSEGGLISGGFFVVSPEIVDYLDNDDTVWEREPLERLAAQGRLGCYRHSGFWHPMDTIRDRDMLQSLWESGAAEW